MTTHPRLWLVLGLLLSVDVFIRVNGEVDDGGTTVDMTRSSAIAEGPRDALYQLKCCHLLQSCIQIIAFEKACSSGTTLKVTQGHCNFRYSLRHMSRFLSVVYSNNDSIWHRFYIYVAACNLEKSFVFEKTVESHCLHSYT